jgi:hypothetical protein
MPIGTLEEIRLLSNLETRRHKLLQIILFGQPELDDNLRKPEIRQLRERITHSFNLAPLNADEVREYLTFRLRAAGYHGPDLFSERVIRYIWRITGGLTRRINIVADKALLAAYAANTHNVSLKHVKAAAADSEFNAAPRRRSHWNLRSAVALGIALAVGAALTTARYLLPPVGPSPVTAQPAVAAGRVAEARPQAAADTTVASAQFTPTSASEATAASARKHSGSPLPPPVSVGAAGPGHAMEAANSPHGLPVPEAKDLLEQRLLATERWLAEEQGDVFSIQLLGSNDTQMLRSYLETLSNYIEKDKIFVYRTVANQAPSMTVLYGAFPTRAEAVKSLEALPAALKANRPYIRTVQGVRAELAQRKAS